MGSVLRRTKIPVQDGCVARVVQAVRDLDQATIEEGRRLGQAHEVFSRHCLGRQPDFGSTRLRLEGVRDR
eukprot:8411246-Lingulodinium_polyedra.AAC.1